MPNKCKNCDSKDDYNYIINNGLCNGCIGEQLEQLQAQLDKLRWSAVSEGLPKEDGYYLVTSENWFGRMHFQQGIWFFGDRETKYLVQDEFTHWKQIILPEDE